MKTVDLNGREAWTFRRFKGALEEYDIAPYAVLHVGGHHGEEIPYYDAAGVEKVYYVEPDRMNHAALSYKTAGNNRYHILNYAAGSIAGNFTFQRSARTVGGSLSLHHSEVPRGEELVIVKQVRQIQEELEVYPNILVIDTQGTELDVLMSADLNSVDMVIIETRPDDVDLPAAPLWAVTSYLRGFLFEPVENWVHDGYPCTDTVFVRD